MLWFQIDSIAISEREPWQWGRGNVLNTMFTLIFLIGSGQFLEIKDAPVIITEIILSATLPNLSEFKSKKKYLF